jgi:hypothetical protein
MWKIKNFFKDLDNFFMNEDNLIAMKPKPKAESLFLEVMSIIRSNKIPYQEQKHISYNVCKFVLSNCDYKKDYSDRVLSHLKELVR